MRHEEWTRVMLPPGAEGVRLNAATTPFERPTPDQPMPLEHPAYPQVIAKPLRDELAMSFSGARATQYRSLIDLGVEGMSDPTGFASWQSYWRFRQEVTRRQRYLLSNESKAFLEELARTSKSRLGKIDAGKHFCRAQIAHQDVEHPHAGLLPEPAPPSRMVPLVDAASEGRANPKGIPRLYLADNRNTAIAEVRPWIGSLVSVGYFKTVRDLVIVDCRDDAGKAHFYLEGEPGAEERQAAVWSDVAAAFRAPVQRTDDRAEYAPTQIIVEQFQDLGYDGVIYGSAFGSAGSNLVLFDAGAAELVSTELHEVKGVTLDTKEAANPYFVERQADGTVQTFRNVITAIGPVDGPLIELDT